MASTFTLGKIVKSDNFDQAKELFASRRQLGIGGVIFTPPVYVPDWGHTTKKLLGKRAMEVHPETLEVIVRSQEDLDRRDIAGKVASRIVRISKEFNASNRTRRVMFVENDELNLPVHRDKIAHDGFFHLHWKGEGMVCLNPVGDEPVEAVTLDNDNTKFNHGDIKRLFAAGKIEAVPLDVRQAVVFDDTMVHLSGQGLRFRILAMG